MNKIPYEDDITKTDLWKRIDSVFPVIANIKDELYPQILGIKEAAMTLVKAEIERNQSLIQQYDAHLQSRLLEHTKEINNIVIAAMDKVTKENLKNIAALEHKIRNVQAEIPQTVKQQTKDYLDPTNTKVAEMRKELDIFKKSLLDTTGKMGTELVSKISSLDGKLNEVLTKFRKLTSNF